MPTILCLIQDFYAQLIVIFYPGVLVFWIIFHNNIERLRRLGTRGYWVAAFAWTITAGPLIVFRREVFSLRWTPPETVATILAGIGVIAFFVGVGVLYQASHHISFRTMVGLPELKPQQNRQPLLNIGIYSKTRNPIYFAHWLVVFSTAALSNFAANWIMFALEVVALPLLIRSEERELRARYGAEFMEYMRRVPRFFPHIR
jgi:protein-S-isoprenylcysteine O-methyltransferase Ste14